MTKCRVCGNEHVGGCAQFFASQSSAAKPDVSKKVEVKKPAPAAKSVSQSATLASSTYRHRDVEARRLYQRDLMRSRRRAAKRVSP